MLLLLAAAALAAGQPAEHAAINRAYGELAASRKAGDVAGMVGHFDPQALIIDSRPGPTLDGQALAAQLARNAQRMSERKTAVATQYRLERRTISGRVAVDSGFARMTFAVEAAAPGQPLPQDMVRRFLVTWQQGADGRWRIIGDAAMPATEAQWQALKPVAGLRFD